jgi:hypothetical protein
VLGAVEITEAVRTEPETRVSCFVEGAGRVAGARDPKARGTEFFLACLTGVSWL